MTKYTFELDNYSTTIEMQEFDDIAQIFVNGELLTEYQFHSNGCRTIFHLDQKKLIDTLVGVLYDQAAVKVEEVFERPIIK